MAFFTTQIRAGAKLAEIGWNFAETQRKECTRLQVSLFQRVLILYHRNPIQTLMRHPTRLPVLLPTKPSRDPRGVVQWKLTRRNRNLPALHSYVPPWPTPLLCCSPFSPRGLDWGKIATVSFFSQYSTWFAIVGINRCTGSLTRANSIVTPGEHHESWCILQRTQSADVNPFEVFKMLSYQIPVSFEVNTLLSEFREHGARNLATSNEFALPLGKEISQISFHDS